MHYFTPREVEHLTGVQPSTVREWRRQIGRDIGRQEDSDRWRFTAGDALMIWMISRARDEDAGVMRAWQVGSTGLEPERKRSWSALCNIPAQGQSWDCWRPARAC